MMAQKTEIQAYNIIIYILLYYTSNVHVLFCNGDTSEQSNLMKLVEEPCLKAAFNPASALKTQPALCVTSIQHNIWPTKCMSLRNVSSYITRLKAMSERASTAPP
jgi:hypothetical protein